MEVFRLPNNVTIPKIGYGSCHLWPWKTRKPLLSALDNGFRLIDTANIYLNERTIRSVLRKCDIPRKDIFLVSKIWPTYYEDEDSVERTLKRLGVDYLDCLLLHHPSETIFPDTKSWRRPMKKASSVRSASPTSSEGNSRTSSPISRQSRTSSRWKDTPTAPKGKSVTASRNLRPS